MASTVAVLLERAAEVLDLGVTSDKPAEDPRGHRLQAPTDWSRAGDFENVDGIGHALDRHRPERRYVDVPFGQLEGVGGDQDGAGPCDLLHAGGEVSGLPNGGVIHMEIASDRADDHLARVQPDADLDRHTLRTQEVRLQRGEACLHPERSVAGSYGVVLEGDR